MRIIHALKPDTQAQSAMRSMLKPRCVIYHDTENQPQLSTEQRQMLADELQGIISKQANTLHHRSGAWPIGGGVNPRQPT